MWLPFFCKTIINKSFRQATVVVFCLISRKRHSLIVQFCRRSPEHRTYWGYREKKYEFQPKLCKKHIFWLKLIYQF